MNSQLARERAIRSKNHDENIELMAYPLPLIRTVGRYFRLFKLFKNWQDFLLNKLTGKLQGRQMQLRSGLNLRIEPETAFTFKDVFLHDCYHCQTILNSLPERPQVLGVGANVGLFSLWLFNRCPSAHVIAYEPMPRNFRSLIQNKEINPELKWDIVEAAVTCSGEAVRIYYAVGDRPSTDASIIRGNRSGHSLEVRSETLADAIGKFPGGRVDWVKLDCEGAEFDLIYGLPPEMVQRVNAFSIEVHEGEGDSKTRKALSRYLQQHGYKLFWANDSVIHAVLMDMPPKR